MRLSVVLPCAFEHANLRRTVHSVHAATPAAVLREIIVVDDGSWPPLATLLPDAAAYSARVLRHRRPRGLIAAKITGGEAALGEVLVFFDCHVRPEPGYWRPMVARIAANYRAVVVPTITSLNASTWMEYGPGMSKCYLTMDAEFKWTADATEHVPLMSGGLLAISRRWWAETGGLDPEMCGWGGENVDQSLRIWRCGGEIVTAHESRVAHMWRDGTSRTSRRYPLPPTCPSRNKARAAGAHMGRWFAKARSFPSFAHLGDGAAGEVPLGWSPPNTTRGGTTGRRCHSFSWYLERFAYIYRDAAVLPAAVFQLATRVGGRRRCLQLADRGWGHTGASTGSLQLEICDGSDHSMQWWHVANRIGPHAPPKAGGAPGTCCSGMRGWNTDQCLSVNASGVLATSECTLEGDSHAQALRLLPGGTLELDTGRPSPRRHCAWAARRRGASVEAVSLVSGDCSPGALRWERLNTRPTQEFELLPRRTQAEWVAAQSMDAGQEAQRLCRAGCSSHWLSWPGAGWKSWWARARLGMKHAFAFAA